MGAPKKGGAPFLNGDKTKRTTGDREYARYYNNFPSFGDESVPERYQNDEKYQWHIVFTTIHSISKIRWLSHAKEKRNE